jgi:hypothetical protein
MPKRQLFNARERYLLKVMRGRGGPVKERALRLWMLVLSDHEFNPERGRCYLDQVLVEAKDQGIDEQTLLWASVELGLLGTRSKDEQGRRYYWLGGSLMTLIKKYLFYKQGGMI